MTKNILTRHENSYQILRRTGQQHFCISVGLGRALCMPLVEAMASHTPVVATRGGAFPEIVEDGRSGLLVERGDAQALAGAILQLLSNPCNVSRWPRRLMSAPHRCSSGTVLQRTFSRSMNAYFALGDLRQVCEK
jgi:glycosyltransferase involved in cell wall biosynthesis